MVRTALFVLALGALVMAIGSSPSAEVLITSEPAGALVTLKGEAVAAGVAPARFQQPLFGQYQVIVSKPGYETRRRRVVLDPQRPSELNIRLAPKTGPKAALRSMLIPGWGQAYSGRSTAALAYVGMTAASAVAYLVIDHRFDDKYADYQRVKTAYDASTSDEERQDLWSRLQTTQRDAYDAEDFRRAAITVTAALYAANVLDALIFMPRRANTPDAKGLTLTPGSGHNAAGATLSYRF